MIKLHIARSRLIGLWGYLSVPLIIIVWLQAVFGKYGNTTSEMSIGFEWVMSMILPNFSIMIAAMTIKINNRDSEKNVNNPTIYRLTLTFSCLYFMCLYSVFLLEPLVDISIQNLLSMTNKTLIPLQGVMAGLISKFFIENA